MKKSAFLTLLLFASTILYAQQTSESSAVFSGFHFENKIYLFIGAVLSIFLCLAFFLLKTDNRIKKAEKRKGLEVKLSDVSAESILSEEHVELEEIAFEEELSSVA